jgi:3-oxoadipate enol-lactonase
MPRITIGDVKLYYETTVHGPPLLFIHGLGSSTRDWDPQVAEFSASYKVITFDLRGHGRSDKPPGPYSLPLFAEDTAGLLGALGLDAAHVVGISLGGGVAFQLAIDHPELVETMTIVNSSPSMVGSTQDAQREIDRRVGIVRQLGMRAMGEALSTSLFPDEANAAERKTFVEHWAENDPQAYIDATLSMLGWDVTAKIGSIKCPTLVISADHDYTPVAVKEAYVGLMPDARLVVIPNSHHATPIERPSQFNAALASFLTQQAEHASSD